MTVPTPLTPEERLAELESRMNVLEQLQQQRTEIIAMSVMATLTEDGAIREYIHKITHAMEAEWTGTFLPELQATVLRRIEELEKKFE